MVPAELVVTGGLAVTRGPGLVNFFRLFTMTFFFLMTRTRTRCCAVPGDQGEQHRGRKNGMKFQTERSASQEGLRATAGSTASIYGAELWT